MVVTLTKAEARWPGLLQGESYCDSERFSLIPPFPVVM